MLQSSAIRYRFFHFFYRKRDLDDILEYSSDEIIEDLDSEGSGSMSSGSAKSITTLRSDLDESLSSSNSFPNSPGTAVTVQGKSPVSINGVALQRQRQNDMIRNNVLALSSSTSANRFQLRSKSQETLSSYKKSLRDEDLDFSDSLSCDEEECVAPKRSYTESEIRQYYNNNNNNNNHLKDFNIKHVKYSGSVVAVDHPKKSSLTSDTSELPRLIGTKSQASTASSSATRDSGISINEIQQKQLLQLQQQLQHQNQLLQHSKRHSSSSTHKQDTNMKGSLQNLINIDDIPVNGKALALSTRPGVNRSSLDDLSVTSVAPSRNSSKYTVRTSESDKPISLSRRPSVSRGSSIRPSKLRKTPSKDHIGSSDPVRSANAVKETLDLEFLPNVNNNPRRKSCHITDKNLSGSKVSTPSQNPTNGIDVDAQSTFHLRRPENSPFSMLPRSAALSSSNSTPYSQISAPSSCDYEEDFTSDSESEMSALALNNRSAHSQRTVGSTGSSRIPIKRNSSLRRKKDVMSQYGGSHPSTAETVVDRPEKVHIPQLEVETMSMAPTLRNGNHSSLSRRNFDARHILPSKQVPMRSISYQPPATLSNSNTPNMPFKFLRSSSPSKIPTSSKSSAIRPKQKTAPLPSPPPSPKPIRRSVSERRIHTSSSENGSFNPPEPIPNISLSSKLPRKSLTTEVLESLAIQSPASDETFDPVSAVPVFNNLSVVKHSPVLSRKELSPIITPAPRTPITFVDVKTKECQERVKSISPDSIIQGNPATPEVIETLVQIHHSASSPVKPMPSAVLTQNGVKLKTQVTLKSPMEGQNLSPYHKPEEFLDRITDNLTSTDWEQNYNGMVGVYRLAMHHPEYLAIEYKPLLQHLMNHVKNLRSQVCRAAVMVVGELFVRLKRIMEPELDKIFITLLQKSGDTNKFLREDCNIALDSIVENVSPNKIISVITMPEILGHKNPVVRAAVSRVLSYTVDRMGVGKCMSGAKDVTEKVLPAIAKLAQDGSPDARNYSKHVLQKMVAEYPNELDKLLKKHLSPNALRNIEKIVENLKQPARKSRHSGRQRDSRKTL